MIYDPIRCHPLEHSQTTHFWPGTARLMVADVAQVLHQWQEVVLLFFVAKLAAMDGDEPQKQLAGKHIL